MPNHVRNILSFECDDERRAEILGQIQNDDLGPGRIDFNKLIPMPKSLDMTSGSAERVAINAYLTAVNPLTPDYGKEKFLQPEFQELTEKLDAMRIIGSYKVNLTEEEMQKSAEQMRWGEGMEDMSASEILAKAIGDGQQYVANALEHGATTWYGWCNREWGTKWNAYDIEQRGDDLVFSTAWACPEPVIQALAEKYPDVCIQHSWADEDLGFNVGEAAYRDGEQVEENLPEPGSREAYELAAGIWQYDLAELGFALTEDDGSYTYKDPPEEQTGDVPEQTMG